MAAAPSVRYGAFYRPLTGLFFNIMSSGFLDIDKLIEDRKQPEVKAARQLATPQRMSTPPACRFPSPSC